MKVCEACNKGFANNDHYKRHIKESKLHAENIDKIKFAQKVLLI